MAENSPGGGKGLLDSLAALTATLIAIVHTRLDLLSSDLEEERAHLYTLFLSTLIALFCFGVGVLLATLLLVVVFWDTHRLLALGSVTGLFLVAGLAAWRYAVRKASSKPKLFAASLAELSKDHQQLSSRSPDRPKNDLAPTGGGSARGDEPGALYTSRP